MLWRQVKSVVRSIEKEEGVLIFEDMTQEKASTDESELMYWHYDHVSDRMPKASICSTPYHVGEHSKAVSGERLRKPTEYCDDKPVRLCA